MGRRSAADTLAKLFVAFLEQATWAQADLARRCELSTKSLRRKLVDLSDAGVPLDCDSDPPHVYWSVPEGWLGFAGAGFEGVDRHVVARMVSRLTDSRTRERVLAKLVVPALGAPIVPNLESSAVSDDVLNVLEDAAKARRAVRMEYQSAHRPASFRTVSVHRVEYGERVRFVASCHATNTLKWFRADRVQGRPRLDATTPYAAAAPEAIAQFVAESLDGFRGAHDAVACDFRVRARDARWVVSNLPRGAGAAVVHHDTDYAHVSLRTSALEILARFLVGLGGAVGGVSPPSLRRKVRAIAEEALLAHGEGRPRGPQSVRSVRQIGATREGR